MPFKDIDWSKLAKQTQVSYNIGRANAIINAQSDKNIQKVELLSGINLVERNPLDEAIQMEKIVREQQPIISKLKEISEKTISPQALTTIMQKIPAIEYDRVVDHQPPAITSTTTSKSQRRSRSNPITIDMNEGIDPNIISKYNYKMPSDIIKEIAHDKEKLTELTNQQSELVNTLKRLGARKKHDETLNVDHKSLQKYNEAMKTILANHSMIKKTKSSTSTSTGKGVKNRIYYTNPKQLTQRLSVLVGEVQAGNNSKSIKNEIADIAHHLYKKKTIKKKEYRSILNSIVSN